ncbi:hypothetical protein D3C86_2120670 [compost metagenome]
MFAGQAPADFGRWGKRCVETDHAEPGKTDELARVLAFQGPETETMLGKMTTDSPDQ